MSDYFKLCSSCRTPIAFEQAYFSCSVSTCNRKRLGLFFCSLPCWEAHLPMMRHRDAWAEQQKAPTREAFEREQAESGGSTAAETRAKETSREAPRSPRPATEARPSGDAPRDLTPMQREARLGVVRRDAAPGAAPEVEEFDESELPRDVLIVASKLKQYVKARSGFNTSDNVMDVLSDHVRRVCVEAIKNAARDGRKTVLDRDFIKAVT